MNDQSIILACLLWALAGFVLGRLSHRKELEYLRMYQANRETLDRIENNIRKMEKP